MKSDLIAFTPASRKKLTLLTFLAITALSATSPTFADSIDKKEEYVAQCFGAAGEYDLLASESGALFSALTENDTDGPIARARGEFVRAVGGGVHVWDAVHRYAQAYSDYESRHTSGQVRRMDEKGTEALDNYFKNRDWQGAVQYFKNCDSANQAIINHYDW